MGRLSFLVCLANAFSMVLAVAVAAGEDALYVCGAKGVSVRLPPDLEGYASDQQSRAWQPPPRGFYFKPWNMIYATHAANLALRNFQYDPSLVDDSQPNGDINDLSSFQIPGNDTVFTTYGVDTRLTLSADRLKFSGTGIITGAYSTYNLLAWGCDENRLPYYANYATATELTGTPAGIDIMSIEDTGMDDKTFAAIRDALVKLGNAEITEMARNLTKTNQDGARRNLDRITTCDDYCKTNQNMREIIGA
ncbi:unnamed protein product [Periconia digitata]|uniref:Uncharacterized protein n=1 Tax=Periconia digitata TaxID=1303443 RepID=A0A9W4U1F8_9PLEO|nr:unnamed protein product [Periconia digitata]